KWKSIDNSPAAHSPELSLLNLSVRSCHREDTPSSWIASDRGTGCCSYTCYVLKTRHLVCHLNG
ncbi:hypothetical protein GOODEAATRI_020876, partial [Goodea atripinnis]